MLSISGAGFVLVVIFGALCYLAGLVHGLVHRQREKRAEEREAA